MQESMVEIKNDISMSPEQFRVWRRKLGLKQKEAADLLGLKKRMIQYYEKGNRDGKPVSIPKSVRLACFAIQQGVQDYNGSSIVTHKMNGFDGISPPSAFKSLETIG